jgi:hypothetical protein
MAKRRSKPAAAKKAKAATRTAKKAPRAPRARKAVSKLRSPRAQPLPGMEQVRDVQLDRICESIGETRDTMNKLRSDEAGDERAALLRMRTRSLTSYRHAGVELARVPGEEKLRVRTSRTSATAETDEAGEPGEEAGGEGGPVETLEEA